VEVVQVYKKMYTTKLNQLKNGNKHYQPEN